MASGAVRELITKVKFVLDKSSESKVNQSIQRLKQTLNNLSRQKISPSINTQSINNASTSVQRLGAQLRKLSTIRANPQVNVQQTGIKGSNLAAAGSGLGSGLAGVAGVIGGGMAISQIKDTADEMMNLDGRLRTVTKTERERLDVESELYALGQKTRQPLSSLGDLYFKVARASEEMGFAQKDNLQVTETVSKALIVGGASAQEASATILQLGQALGSGRLQGDELRSLDENASILMKHVAKYFKTNVAGLKEMGRQGELTSDEVMKAILSASEAIDKEFKDMPMTFGQAMNVMGNSWDRFILGVNQKSGVFSLIARSFTKAFDSMGNKLNDFLTLMGTPDPNKTVTITDAVTGETKEISETDYYNQKATENPGMVQVIETMRKLEQMFDRLDGKEGNLDEQIGNLIETFMKIGLVVVPLLAIIGMIDGLIMLLSPFIGLVQSVGGALAAAFKPVLAFIEPILGAGLAPLLAILAAIASVIYFVGENWETVVSWFQPGIDSIMEGIAELQQAWQNLQPFIEAIIPLLKVIATVVGGAIVGAISLLFRVASWVFNQIASFINWVAGLLGGLGETIQWVAGLLGGLIDKVRDFIGIKGAVGDINTETTNRLFDEGRAGGTWYNSQTNYLQVSSAREAAQFTSSSYPGITRFT